MCRNQRCEIIFSCLLKEKNKQTYSCEFHKNEMKTYMNALNKNDTEYI